MKIGILTFEQMHGRVDVGSSRIRGDWLIKYWDEAERFVLGTKYDVVIFQKAYWVEYAKEFKGIKILDLCDPDWMHFGYPVKEMIELCDAVTCSSEEIKNYISKITDKPVYYIPDRVDLEVHNIKKQHIGDAKNVVWFGYHSNFALLDSTIISLKTLKLSLIVISDKPYIPPAGLKNRIEIINLPWDVDTVNSDIIRGDIVLNPIIKVGKWKFKSNNKTLTSWALGMPVANDNDDLKLFLKEENRIKESEKRLKEIIELWDVKISVQDFKDIIERLKDIK